MNLEYIDKMTIIFRLLGNKNRLRVLYLCQEMAVSVGDIVNELQQSQSLVSHHLKYLRDEGLIKANREGKRMLYQVKDKRVQCILKDMKAHVIADSKKKRRE